DRPSLAPPEAAVPREGGVALEVTGDAEEPEGPSRVVRRRGGGPPVWHRREPRGGQARGVELQLPRRRREALGTRGPPELHRTGGAERAGIDLGDGAGGVLEEQGDQLVGRPGEERVGHAQPSGQLAGEPRVGPRLALGRDG